MTIPQPISEDAISALVAASGHKREDTMLILEELGKLGYTVCQIQYPGFYIDTTTEGYRGLSIITNKQTL